MFKVRRVTKTLGIFKRNKESEPPIWGRQKGVTPILFVPISPFSSDLFRFALLVLVNTLLLCSDLFGFAPFSSDLFRFVSEQIRTNQEKTLLWVLPEDYCKRDPCNFNTKMFVSNWSTSSQLDFVRALSRRKQYEIAQTRFCTQSCSKVGQLLVNSSSTPRPMASCRGLPCNSPQVFFPTTLKCEMKSPHLVDFS